jgi:hypothetical protein
MRRDRKTSGASPGYRTRGNFPAFILSVSPALPRQHHVDIPAATPGADKPIASIQHRDAHAVTLREFGGIRLDLTLAGLAPHDDPDARGSCAA